MTAFEELGVLPEIAKGLVEMDWRLVFLCILQKALTLNLVYGSPIHFLLNIYSTFWYSFTFPPPKKKVEEKVHNKAK